MDLNYVVIYESMYGMRSFRYMSGKNAKEVKNVFTAAYPDRKICSIFVSVDDVKSCISALNEFI